METAISRSERRASIHRRVRSRIRGTSERPRLSVFRSKKHIYAQVIDDESSRTLVSASTLDQEFKATNKKGSTKEGAAGVGALVARKTLEKGIKRVVFDRGGYLYHGRVKALADAARKESLEF